MDDESTTRKTTARAIAENRRAIAEAKAAYAFVPNSFTYSCLSACLAAEQALAVLADGLSA